ncbi:hypothetical protein GCM10022286_22110 [Gryllotalpicola daejeonensis]|uniref:RNA polymerase sigma-70 domain-containing protein n=1 Tax=Gryllotalpicola daejeonensis TaxID=993087 RepID=A0ABP7ZLU8_9MICO
MKVDDEGFIIDRVDRDLPERWKNIRPVSADPIKDYLRTIGRAPLLTAEEEVSLAKEIEVGVVAQGRLAQPATAGSSSAYRRELTLLARQGRNAYRRMAHANLRLVVSIAKRFLRSGVPFLDLIQEGNIGLLRAIEMFDYSLGNKFSTYATWWIRQSITRAIADRGRLIRVPVHVNEDIGRLRSARTKLEHATGREPLIGELAQAVAKDIREVERLFSYDRPVLSLDTPLRSSESDGSTVADLLVDGDAASLDEAFAAASLKPALEQLLLDLPQREADILRLRAGLVDGRQWTLDSIGEMFGVTRERIRQLEKSALAQLRAPKRRRFLAEFLTTGESERSAGRAFSARRPWQSTPSSITDMIDADGLDSLVRWAVQAVARSNEVDPGKRKRRRQQNAPSAPARLPASSRSRDDQGTTAAGVPPGSSESAQVAIAPDKTRGVKGPATNSTSNEIPKNAWTDYPEFVSADVASRFRGGATPQRIAAAWGIDSRDVVVMLCMTVFQLDETSKHSADAYQQGQRYSDVDLMTILSMIREGAGVTAIAHAVGRTPFAIASQIVSRDKFRKEWLASTGSGIARRPDAANADAAGSEPTHPRDVQVQTDDALDDWKKQPRYAAQVRDGIVTAYRRGRPPFEIAYSTGLSQAEVVSVLASECHGIAVADPATGRQHFSGLGQDGKARVSEMRGAGATVPEIAHHLGLPAFAVAWHVILDEQPQARPAGVREAEPALEDPQPEQPASSAVATEPPSLSSGKALLSKYSAGESPFDIAARTDIPMREVIRLLSIELLGLDPSAQEGARVTHKGHALSPLEALQASQQILAGASVATVADQFGRSRFAIAPPLDR